MRYKIVKDEICYFIGCKNIAIRAFVAKDSDHGIKSDYDRFYYILCCNEHNETYSPNIHEFTIEEFEIWMIHNE